MKILLDMDGVIVDLVGHIMQTHDWDLETVLEQLKPGAIFNHLDIDWWASAPKTKEADDIIKLISGHEVCILTQFPAMCSLYSRENDHIVAAGKCKWLFKHYPHLDKLIGGPKRFGHGVLIDDSEREVREFVKNKGRAVLVPRPWNRLKGVDVMTRLKERLK